MASLEGRLAVRVNNASETHLVPSLTSDATLRFLRDYRLLTNQFSNADSSVITLLGASLSPNVLHGRTPTDVDSCSSLGDVWTVKPVRTFGESTYLISRQPSCKVLVRQKTDLTCVALLRENRGAFP